MKKTKKNDYISYKDVKQIIDKNGLQYLLMIGQRSNGKSYASKELALRESYKTGQPAFTYLRRHQSSLKMYMISEYWSDMCVPDEAGNTAIYYITNGEYDTIIVYQKAIYLGKTDPESGKVERGLLIGYAHALTELEALKSRQFPTVKYILFEEFIATGLYLYQEPDRLQNYVSTVLRDRQGCVLMIGNTISRIVPYFTEWCLDNIHKQEQGTVDVYKFETENTETKIGVFLCESLHKSSGMFFGSSAKMIIGGEWDRHEQSKLPGDRESYVCLYNVVFKYTDKAIFLLSFLQAREHPDNFLWYVEPKTTKIQGGTRVVTPELSDDPLYTKDFTPIHPKEKILFDYIKLDRIAYSDNLTGTEFKRCVEMLHSATTRT